MASEASDNPAAIPEGQSENTAAVAWEEQGWNGHSEDLTASHIQHSDQQHQEPAISVDPAPNSASSGDSASDDEDAGEYDPESITFPTTDPVPVAAATAAAPTLVVESEPEPEPAPELEPEQEQEPEPEQPRPSKKPKTKGGFLVGSSDDEDDEEAPTPTLTPTQDTNLKPVPVHTSASAPTPVPAQTFSPSPLQQSTTSQELPAQIPAQVPAQVSNDQNTTNSAGAAASTTQPATDYIDNLEDRVKEDPRGAVNAWLELVREHRSRGQIDGARAVYERFFKIFPQAVSSCIIS